MFLERSEHGYSPPSTTQYPLTTTRLRPSAPSVRTSVRAAQYEY